MSKILQALDQIALVYPNYFISRPMPEDPQWIVYESLDNFKFLGSGATEAEAILNAQANLPQCESCKQGQSVVVEGTGDAWHRSALQLVYCPIQSYVRCKSFHSMPDTSARLCTARKNHQGKHSCTEPDGTIVEWS